MDKTQIRDAATIIVLRDQSVLMGQRGAKAAFMPGKFVFPGGAVDAGDAQIELSGLHPQEAVQLRNQSNLSPETLTVAAIRELWEETGQILGQKLAWTDAPHDWADFAARGYRPDATGMQMFFRAVTPKGRPRRFDARFFLVDATYLATDPDDFSTAQDELSHLQWIPLSKARSFDLPFITKVVLAELNAHIKDKAAALSVPFFRNDDEAHLITRLGGASVL
jgi:8-oxo-dGTP pyrophosphatase MutT (NUDIX family)